MSTAILEKYKKSSRLSIKKRKYNEVFRRA